MGRVDFFFSRRVRRNHAGVGHINGIRSGRLCQHLQEDNPALNKLLTDSIRTSNQYLVGLSAFHLVPYVLQDGATRVATGASAWLEVGFLEHI